jgi:U3 small nucleolar RNA-associated protein 19
LLYIDSYTSTMVGSLPKSKAPKSAGPPKTSSASALSLIPKLEAALLDPSYDPNPLLNLVALARHDTPEVVHKAVWALHRVFISYIDDGKVGGLAGGLEQGEKERVSESVDEAREVRGWVRDRLLEYVEVLGGLLRDTEPALRVSICSSSQQRERLVGNLLY